MVMEIHGTYKLTYHPIEGDSEKVFEVDFTPPFRRVSMITELEKQLDVTFPPATAFHTPGMSVASFPYPIPTLQYSLSPHPQWSHSQPFRKAGNRPGDEASK